MDPEDEAVQPICRPFSYLGPAKDWADQEERRRVFWNVFLLDRFCSITMGWNTSLTSIDVHQRLPCDGILWRKQEAVLTPYLGIWDKSTGGIGNMSAASARRGSQSTLEMDHQGQTTGPYSSHRQPETDVSRIGAFAYCVEATESMSRVTTYFLQQRINPNDPEAVNSWLSRFKELDLRLVHWKMFLPQKWKPNVPKQASRMDPNLTLAHITHNASTILLHQLIAWPPPSWPFRKRLPSVWSVETCRSAGIEISTITRKYLENTPGMLPITSPFGFCVYIAARMMLVHWHHDPSNHHLEEFWSMIKSLEEMSRRWNGVARDSEVQPRDLAAKYGAKLRDMYQRCLQDDDFQINVADYAQDIDHRSLKQTEGRRCWASANMNGQTQQYPDHPESQQLWSTGNPSMTSMAPFPNMNMATHQPHGTSTVQFATVDGNQDPLGGSVSDNPADPTSICSGSFNAVEDYFMDMDRVIAFNDGSLFSAGLGDGSW